MSVLFPSLAAIIGVVIGSLLTHLFSIRREKQAHLRQQRSKIYGEFLEAFAASALVKNPQELLESDRRIAGARTQIVLIGGDETLKWLGELFEHREFSEGKGEQCLVRLIAEMRVDVLSDQTHSNPDLVKQAVHGKSGGVVTQ